MANIDTLLQQILTAVYGEDVRGSIHDAIAAMNDESSEAISVSKTAQDSAKNSADAAAKSATDAADAVTDLDSKHTSAVTDVANAKTDALDTIATEKEGARKSIASDKNDALTSIANEKTNSITEITASKTDALDSISSANAKAEAFKTAAQSYAEGGTGTREGEDTDNAKYYMEQAQKAALGNLDDKMSDTSENAVKNMVIKAYVDGHTPNTATIDKVGVVKPDGKTITIDDDGTIHGSAQNDLKLTIVGGKLNATYTKETS